MGNSRRFVSVRSYALAFAVVLSPAFLQQVPCTRGNADLLSLELEVDGGPNLIVGFDPVVRNYDVSTSGSTATVRADALINSSIVNWVWRVEGVAIGGEEIGVDGGEVTLPISIPDGQSELQIAVRIPPSMGTATALYKINIERVPPVRYACTEAGIRQAIADGGGPHYFDCAGPTTLLLGAPFEQFHTDVILDGEGNITLDGRNLDNRVFNLLPGDTVELRGFTVTGAGPSTAAILNQGTLTLTDTTITGNTRGGITNLSTGALILDRSTVSGNTGWGGINSDGASVTAIDSTISNNSGNQGGGIRVTAGTVTLRNTTVSGNNSAGDGGGMHVSGATTVGATNTTFSGNSAAGDGGGFHSSGAAELTVVHCTVVGNSAAGLGSAGFGADTTAVTLQNNLIEGTCAAVGTPTLQSNGHNIESPGNTCGLVGTGDLVFVSPIGLFGALQDNGGPTLTYAPLPTSLAIDLVPQAACVDHLGALLFNDQRGIERPENTDCDAGAVEGYCESCDDGNECTVGACDPITRACVGSVPVADGAACESEQGTCFAGACSCGWGVDESIESSDLRAGRPQVAVDAQGNAMALWQEWDPDANTLMMWSRRFTPSEGWESIPRLVHQWDNYYAYGYDSVWSSVAMDPQGNAVALWHQRDADGTTWNLYSSYFTPPHTWELVAEPLNTQSGSVSLHDLAMDAQGNAIAVWGQFESGTGHNIWWARFTQSNGWGTADLLESYTGSANGPKIAMNAQGDAIAVWGQRKALGNDIAVNHFTPLGCWEGDQVIVSEFGGVEQVDNSMPQIGMDSEGNALVVWLSQLQQGAPEDLRSIRYTASSDLWGPPHYRETSDKSVAGFDLAVNAQGAAVVLWHQPEDFWDNVYANHFTPSGGWGPEPGLLEHDDEYHASRGEVVMDAEGNALALWEQRIDFEHNLYSSTFSPAGGWDGPALAESSEYATFPKLAMNPQGDAVSVWVNGVNVEANRHLQCADRCADVNCPDGNDCTSDVCEPWTGSCSHPPLPDGTSCDSGSGQCVSGVCDHCVNVTCTPDGNECTDDCSVATGTCDHLSSANGTPCDSGNGECLSGQCDLCPGLVCDPFVYPSDPCGCDWTEQIVTGQGSFDSAMTYIAPGRCVQGLDVSLYDLATNTWTPLSPANQPPTQSSSDRRGYAISYLTDDKVVMFGGWRDYLNSYYDETWVYDLSDNAWTQLAPTTSPAGRSFAKMAYLGNGKALLFGGYSGGSVWHVDTWIYDANDQNWHLMNPTGGPPSGRALHGMAHLGDRKAIILGGQYDFVGIQYPRLRGSTWIYDLGDGCGGSWTLIGTQAALNETLLAPIGEDMVMVYGGLNIHQPPLPEIVPRDAVWVIQPPDWDLEYVGPGPYRRSGHVGCETSLDGSTDVVVHGGRVWSGSGGTLEYDVLGDTWTFGEVSTP